MELGLWQTLALVSFGFSRDHASPLGHDNQVLHAPVAPHRLEHGCTCFASPAWAARDEGGRVS